MLFFLPINVTKNQQKEIFMEPLAVTVEQAAKLCNTSRPTITKWLQDPRLPCLRTGNKILIPLAGLKKFIELLGAERSGVI